MPTGGVLAPDHSYVVSPRRDPDSVLYVVPLVREPNQCLPSSPASLAL